MDQSNARVVVAEDNAITRMLIADTLTDAGFRVIEAASGHEAISVLQSAGGVDLLVTDIDMPGADGITVADRARANNPDVSVLFISSRGDQLESRCAAGPYRILPKPFSYAGLNAAVDAMMRDAA